MLSKRTLPSDIHRLEIWLSTGVSEGGHECGDKEQGEDQGLLRLELSGQL